MVALQLGPLTGCKLVLCWLTGSGRLTTVALNN